jgi:hypothetical protein
LAVDHNLINGSSILKRVPIEQDQIGIFSHFKATDSLVNTKKLGGIQTQVLNGQAGV